MNRDVPELIGRLGAVRRAAQRSYATEHGLSLAQLEALDYLCTANRYSDTPAVVAEYLDTTRGTTSQSLRGLERKGLVRRIADAADGRVHHVVPTAAGRRIAEGARHADELRAAVADAPDLDGRLGEALTVLLTDLQRARGHRTFGLCRSCMHLQGSPDERVCGLTGEALSERETALRCAEHAPG